MSSRSELVRNNVRTGIFVSVAIVLVVTTIVAVSDLKERVFQKYRDYLVRYPVETGIGGLGPGSDVRVGGMKMGSVIEVRPVADDGRVQQLEVHFELSTAVELYDHAEVTVNSAMIGSESWIDIRNVGSGAPWPPADPIEGYAAPAVLSGILGHKGAKDAGEFVDFLGDIRSEYDKRIVPTLTNLEVATGDARDMVADLKENHWDEWATSVDHVMTWADGFTTELDGAMSDARTFIGTLQDTVDENRPDVRDSIANVREITEHAKTTTIAKVDELLDHGNSALGDAQELIRTVSRDYDQWAVDLGHTLASASLAAQQLKLATIEVRRNPWKVLYRPQQTELEHELLYESARSFALAAADLRATSDAIERVVSKYGPELSESEPAFRRLRESLDASLERYTTAQTQLLDVLKADVGEKE